MTKVFFFLTVLVLFCASMLLALLLERLDNALCTVTEVARRTQLSFVSVIPEIQPRRPNQHLTAPHESLFSPSAEYFRSFTRDLLHTTSPAKILQITSAVASAGKTTIACNLARVLAENGQKVLLIDADLRRPNVNRFWGLRNDLGLSNILESKCKLEEVVHHLPELASLDILTSSPVPPFPSALLNSDTMRVLLKRCHEIYDYIILDSPPLLSASDGVTLAMQAEAVVLVIRYGDPAPGVVRARDLLLQAGVSIAGFVLNATPTHTSKITLE